MIVPGITEEEKSRLSVCITVPKDTQTDGEIGQMIIPGGKFVVGHFEIRKDQFESAWNMICGGWLPQKRHAAR